VENRHRQDSEKEPKMAPPTRWMLWRYKFGLLVDAPEPVLVLWGLKFSTLPPES